MTAVASDLVGRDAELAVIDRLLHEATAGRSAACVIEGGVGIGKTAVLRAAISRAQQRGFLVLSARPVEAETAFSFAALGDMLRPHLSTIIDRLARPQRAALEAALLVGDVEGPPPDPHAVAVAVLTTLGLLTGERPAIVAVDDAQWLDSPSRSVLRYLARRLPPRTVIVVTERSERDATGFAIDGERVRLGPLSAGALQLLIHERLGIALTRPALARLHEATAGHPLYALEIARVVRASGGGARSTDPLPVPGTLRELVADRLAAVTPGTRRALVSVAASARPTRALLDAASLKEAMAADLVTVDGATVRFTHPLLASVLYAEASPDERRAAHRRLAESAADEEEAARHLALAADGPDEAIAVRLDGAATRAHARGAPSAAAELMEHARELTPETDAPQQLRRRVDAAEYYIEARIPGADRLLESVLDATSGDLRARALHLLAQVRGNLDANAGPPLLEEALTHVADPAIELQIRLALVNPNFRAVTERSLEHADRAIELAERHGDRGALAAALASRAAVVGHPLDALERAAKVEEGSRSSVQARFQVAWAQLARGSDTGRLRLGELLEESLAAGLRAHNRVISLLSYAETRAGYPERGRELAEEFLGYTVAEGNRLGELAALCARAYAAAWLGDLAGADRDAETALRSSDIGGFIGRSIQARGIRGFVALAIGDVPAAALHLRVAVAGVFDASIETLPPVAHTRLVLPTVVADAIEAFSEGGLAEECGPLIAWLDRDPGNPWLAALSAYGRGLLASARADHDDAVAALQGAVGLLEPLDLPLDLGRALLALGAAQRRARHRVDARDSLQRAAALFERCRAELWAAKARLEMSRIGGRRSAGDELTGTERQIASLVAQGKKNREVAAALVVTERTVEAALTGIYRKLEVRSRTELARKLATRGD
jgi:DNA-binding CsgD family transcriptional regulator